MKVTWYGHACFGLRSGSGLLLITDPYDPTHYGPSFSYGLIGDEPDVVTLSHHHPDHAYPEQFANRPTVIETPGEHHSSGLSITGIPTFHDGSRGAERGADIMFVITMDDLRVAHLGDVGTPLTAEQIAAIGQVDLLMVPVGGTFTIDWRQAGKIVEALNPAITIPMHYRTDKCSFNIDGVDKFIAGKENVIQAGTTHIDPGEYVEDHPGSIVVLEHAR